jgi:16S rRNA (guanine966-N2)-methyltransferase
VRVIAGQARGRRLVVPPGIRPTTDRVREAVFSALGSLTGATMLDLFAGSGAAAIEALSRGADRALLVDRNRVAVAACRENLEAAGFADRGRVEARSVAAFLREEPPDEAPFALVFADPPYEMAARDVAGVAAMLGAPGWLTPEASVVVERPARDQPVGAPPGWEIGWERRYGDTLVVVLRAPDRATEPPEVPDAGSRGR